MSADPLAAIVEAMWCAQRDRIVARLLRVVNALEAGVADPTSASDAHRLAGALGTYGRPGSELSREAERALLSGQVEPGLAAALLALVEQGALDGQQQTAGDEQQQRDAQS